MAKRWYTKKAQYRLPAGSMGVIYMDGIYINGYLFENNIPVLDMVTWIQVTPQEAHAVEHLANFGFPTFRNGSVVRIGHRFWWPPGSKMAQAEKLFYSGHPYGMGLNTIAVELSLPLPITRDIIYDVSYIMEVDT